MPPNFDQLDRAVVKVYATRPPKTDDDGIDYEAQSTGTGIVVSEQHGTVRIITALHEVHRAATIQVTFSFDQLKPVTAKLLPISNPSLDAAVLEAALPPGNGVGTLPIYWKPRSALQVAGPMWTVNGSWEPISGNIVKLELGSDINRFAYSVEAAQGYSGGPVFDARGELIGMHLETRPDAGRQLRDGVKVDAIVEWLGSIGYKGEALNRLQEATSLSSSSRPINPGLLASLRTLSPGDRGTLLFRMHNYVAALPLLTEGASTGDPHAATILGGMYIAGQGVSFNLISAKRWWRVGAEGGEPVAMASLAAACLDTRAGDAPDYMESARWYRKAADLGNADAMTGLGLLLANGQITPDARSVQPHPQITLLGDKASIYWFRLGSQAGAPLSKEMLGILYASGRGGLPHDDAKAVLLYREAAEEGLAGAMRLLGDMYMTGRGGLPRDRSQALFWYQKAAVGGDRLAAQRLHTLF